MKAVALVAVALVLTWTTRVSVAQSGADEADLIGTWTLVAAERDIGSEEPVGVRGPRGVLILDGAGYVFEFFSAPDASAEASLSGSQQTLAEYGGFWGHFEADGETGRMQFAAADGVSPSVQGQTFSRDYELDGDLLVVTSADEPQAQGYMRWTWRRFPTVENLSPAYREVVGFWQHVEERQVVLETGEVTRSSQRAPSVIVYTPSGFVGVHFPPQGRESFGNGLPNADEAQAGMRGYIGYFGTLGVYPGEVSHNILSGISPGTGSILRRYANITGDELVVELQSSAPRPADDDRPRTVTEVVLQRLSGAEDMLPVR
jgi:hypothetical protein